MARKRRPQPKSSAPLILLIAGGAALGLLVLGVIGITLVWWAMPPKTTPKAGGPDKVEVLSPGTEVRAEVVAKEANADPVATNAKYKGQTLVVEGPVKAVLRRSEQSGVVVVVSLTGVPSPVEPDGTNVYCDCRFEDDKKATELAIGQTVKIRGRCGENALGPENCTLDSVGPDPSIKVNLTDLVAEFRKNPASAQAKYKGKALIITGATVEQKERSRLKLVTEPRQPNLLTISAQWPISEAVDQKRFDDLKPGDRVTIRCWYATFFLGDLSFADCRLLP